MKVVGGTVMTLDPFGTRTGQKLGIEHFGGVEIVVTDAFRKDGKPNSMRYIKWMAKKLMGYPKEVCDHYDLDLVAQNGPMMKFRMVNKEVLAARKQSLLKEGSRS